MTAYSHKAASGDGGLVLLPLLLSLLLLLFLPLSPLTSPCLLNWQQSHPSNIPVSRQSFSNLIYSCQHLQFLELDGAFSEPASSFLTLLHFIHQGGRGTMLNLLRLDFRLKSVGELDMGQEHGRLLCEVIGSGHFLGLRS